jgi:hypothetical protein
MYKYEIHRSLTIDGIIDFFNEKQDRDRRDGH